MLKAWLSNYRLQFTFTRFVQAGFIGMLNPVTVGYVSKKSVLLRSSHIKAQLIENLGIKVPETQPAGFQCQPPIAIPTCVVQISSESLSSNQSGACFFMDSINYSALIDKNGQSIFWDSINHRECALDELSEDDFFLENTATRQLISLINCARKFSRDIFFVEFPKPFNYQRSIIGYYHRSQIKFIGICLGEIQLFDTPDQLINKFFGTKLKLKEILGYDISSRQKRSFAACNIRKNYFSYCLAIKIPLSENLDINVALLVAYITKQANITRHQKRILQYKLSTEIHSDENHQKSIYKDNYIVYGSPVMDAVYNTLTESQLQLIFEKVS